MTPPRVSGRWWMCWAAAWAAVTVVWLTDVALQHSRAGAGQIHHPLLNSLLVIGPGALLSLVAWAVMSRAELARRPLGVKLGAYILLGALFWFLWSLANAVMARAGLFLGVSPATELFTFLLRALAGLGFNATLLFAALVTAYEVRRHAREARLAGVRTAALRSELARAQMAALDAQLSPHFLFNTMHVASGLMGRDVEGARAVLRDLSGLLRGSLELRGKGFIPLEEELRLTERYLDIQKARFRDRLTVTMEVDETALGLGVPPLLLQPLVENAIVHGISRAETGGCVCISAACDGASLRLTVADSGSGPDAGTATPAPERIGLGGTRRRLELHFGSKAKLELARVAGGGTRARVVLPAVPASEHVEPGVTGGEGGRRADILVGASQAEEVSG